MRCPKCQAEQTLSGMTFIALCPECAKGIEVDDWMIGSFADCPACGKEIIISAPMNQNAFGSQTNVTDGHLQAGDQLGRYRIDKAITLDGSCEDYLAFHTVLCIPCVVKLLKPSIAAQDSFYAERLIRDAKKACALKHRHVIGVIDAHCDNDRNLSYVVTEFAEGMTLREALNNGPLTELSAISIALDISKALLCAEGHGIIHGDIRPANVLLTNDYEAKILGLGIAKLDHEAAHCDIISQLHHDLRTQAYSAPEYLESPQEADSRADLYSLGAVLYHMLSGKSPFLSDNPLDMLTQILDETPADIRQFNPKASSEVCELVSQLMAKKPGDRPQSAGDAMAALEGIRTALRQQPAPNRVVLKFTDQNAPANPSNTPETPARTGTTNPTNPTNPAMSAAPKPGWSKTVTVINVVLAVACLALAIIMAVVLTRNPAEQTPATNTSQGK